MKNTNKLTLSALVVGMIAFSTSAQAALVAFVFNNNGELDGSAPVGTSMVRTENGETVTLSTVGFQSPDFNQANPYANLITTSSVSSIDNPSGLGLNNQTINNSDFNMQTGAGSSEGNHLNFLESITLEFDRDITFASFAFASNSNNDEFIRVNIEGLGTNYDIGSGNTDGTFADPLLGLVISAGTDITFTGQGGVSVSNTKINSIVVDVVPEPSSAALLGLGGLILLMRQRK